MDNETLARAGQLLLGPEWQRPLARLLGPRHPLGERNSLDPRLVQRWASGERTVPLWVWGVLAEMLERQVSVYQLRANECDALAFTLYAMCAAEQERHSGTEENS
jgi:hypothetical protein